MRIGIIDHRFDRSHATTFHRIVSERYKRDAIAIGWEEIGKNASWAEERGVALADDIEEVVEKSDALMLLYPNDIARHLAVCRKLFPLNKAKKPVYIDKFLAPTVRDSKQIAALAKRRGIPIMSSSALHFAVELEKSLKKLDGRADDCIVHGYGSMEIYGIHSVALGVRAMGTGIRRVIDAGTRAHRIVTCEYPAGRRLTINLMTDPKSHTVMRWRYVIRAGEQYLTGQVQDTQGFYTNLLKRVVKFLRTGVSPVSPATNIEWVKILEGAERSRRRKGAWVGV